MNKNNLKLTAFIQLYGLLKIPLVFAVGPRVIESTAARFVLELPLKRKNKNHLGSMYFGAMGIGAELSIAAAAVVAISESKQKIDFVFKDYQAQFLKRGDGNVRFVFDDVAGVRALIAEATKNPERLEQKFKGYAIVPSKSTTEQIMTYELTLSVRNRSLKA